MNQDDPYKAFNSHIKNLNKQISEIKGLVKEEKVEQKKSKKQEILERLRYVAESMRAAGATEQSIQVAVKGMYEFLKVNLGE